MENQSIALAKMLNANFKLINYNPPYFLKKFPILGKFYTPYFLRKNYIRIYYPQLLLPLVEGWLGHP